MENTLYIIMSQATRYLRDPYLPTTDKQLLKRELGTEMVCTCILLPNILDPSHEKMHYSFKQWWYTFDVTIVVLSRQDNVAQV